MADEKSPGVSYVFSGTNQPAKDTPRLSHEEQVAQATAIMSLRLFGEGEERKVAAIAERFGISEETVRRRLRLAEQEGISFEAGRRTLESLVPKALARVEMALDSRDEKLATNTGLKLLEMLKVGQPEEAHDDFGDQNLERWTLEVVRRRNPTAAPAPAEEGGRDGAPILYVPSSGIERLPAEAADDTPGVSEGGGGRGSAARDAELVED